MEHVTIVSEGGTERTVAAEWQQQGAAWYLDFAEPVTLEPGRHVARFAWPDFAPTPPVPWPGSALFPNVLHQPILTGDGYAEGHIEARRACTMLGVGSDILGSFAVRVVEQSFSTGSPTAINRIGMHP